MPGLPPIIKIILLWLLFVCGSGYVSGQNCPPNIGFESGNFNGWQCLSGKINTDGIISMSPVSPIDSLHVMMRNTLPQAKDPYGNFPVNCPNGSGYSIRLGDANSGSKALGVTYTFTVPAGQDDYSVIYNYAVVLQNPEHKDFEQPKFTTKVFDVGANKYLTCASFEFVSAAGLPGFKESPVEKNIFYKDWAPVTMKLTGYAGKTIRLEFTVNDCSRGVHFGYAYLDVDENCSSPISGNTYCNGSGSITLKAPYGFKEYRWYTDDFSTFLGSGNFLKLSPVPAANTKYALDITPYPGQGCRDTLHTSVLGSDDLFSLKIKDTAWACQSQGVDITAATITAGSTPGLFYSYYTDVTELDIVTDPKKITKLGTYYINAKNQAGCTETKPISLVIKNAPVLVITGPPVACLPGAVDLTAAAVTAGSEQGVIYTYWTDTIASSLLPSPASVTKPGTYYIKATDYAGCTTVMPVKASLANPPNMFVTDISSCGNTSLRRANPTAGSDTAIRVTYWYDPAAVSIPISPDSLLKASTTIYVKASVPGACMLVKPVQVSIHPIPLITVTDPPAITRPSSIDLFNTISTTGSWSYSYWLDEKATQPVAQPHEVIQSGTYYIKAFDAYGCNTINPVKVLITDPPIQPVNAFSPNGDGINDVWLIPILAYYPECTVEVFNRTGASVFKSTGGGYTRPWDGSYNGKTLQADTYYYIIKLAPGKAPISGSVTLIR